MRVAFTVDEGGFEADEDSLVCGVTNGEHYLTFQRDAEDSPEDWGIHLEYDDQSNGDYDCVRMCRVDSSSLRVDLSLQLGGLVGVTGFDITLRLSPEQVATVRAGLRRVFRGHRDLLVEAEPGDAAIVLNE